MRAHSQVPQQASKVGLVSLVAVAAVLLTSSNLRSSVSSFPPIAGDVTSGLNASTMFIGLVGMAPTAMFALAAAMSGPLARMLSFRAVTTTAMVLAAAGFGARAVAPNEPIFLAGTMVGLVGVGITNTLLPAVVKNYFPFRLTVMSMAYLVAGQFSMATASVVAVPLANWAGWRVAIGVWAIPPVLAVICWGVLVYLVTPGAPAERGKHMLHRSRPKALYRAVRSTRGGNRPPEQGSGGGGGGVAAKNIWRHPVAWGIVAMFAMTSSISYCFITWAPKIIVESGGSPEFGGVIGGVFATVGIVSAIVVPWAVGRFAKGAAAVTVCSCACMYVALAMVLYDPMFHPVGWISLVSLGCSTFPLGMLLVATRTREAKAAARLSSGAQTVGYTVACLGPFGFGALFDATGSWDTGLTVLLGVNTALLVAGLIASRNVYVDD
ncbi:MAG TPA: MFS transporter [Candidatus Corynebacterium gallistercoris]|uniref:MFS transporter n=1 Tax=Candidatus Corynebacterium gallistercoris TaxID=2838530 RepID=A0A9D1RVQ2_9CORY|nr:MFS transporter [Candidatus Corynebacterium gallistercoris]